MKDLFVILKNWAANNNTTRAAALAFYALFSFSPLLILTFNFSSLFIDKSVAKKEIINQLSQLISPYAAELIKNIFTNNSFQLTSSLLSLIIIFYASSKIFSVIRSSFNVIFSVEISSRKEKILNFFEGQILSFLLVPVTCIFFLLSLLSSVFLNNTNYFFAFLKTDYIHIYNFINYFISFFILVSVSFSLLRFLPSKKIPTLYAFYGSCCVAILYEFGRYFITAYLSYSFIKGFYGSMGSLVVIMLWVYYTTQILLLGAEITNYIMQKSEKKI